MGARMMTDLHKHWYLPDLRGGFNGIDPLVAWGGSPHRNVGEWAYATIGREAGFPDGWVRMPW